MKDVNIKVNKDCYEELKALAVRDGRTIKETFKRLVENETNKRLDTEAQAD